MLRALAEHGIRPDLVVGTSIGALNGAFVAADPSIEGAQRLATVWDEVGKSGLFSENPMRSAARLARFRTHILTNAPLRTIIDEHLPVDTFEELAVPFQCVAACIETAESRYFSTGEIVEPVVASCTVPGLFPPVEIDGLHYLDGGLVHSIPVGRALALGATRIFVLQVGRVETPLEPPHRPWEVGMVAFEIARRHRYVHEMATIPDDVEVHVLPSGAPDTPSVSLSIGRTSARHRARAEKAHAASSSYLAFLGG